jgi:hypothetical protein
MKSDSKICPLCGGDNFCGSRGKHGWLPLCWCATEGSPRALLDKVPSESKMRTCICVACVRSFKTEQDALISKR